MTDETNNFSASDMATAAAQGFRDGQKVALAGATNNASVPVAWQFCMHGEWINGNDRIKDHRKNTEAAGIPVRDLYTTPPSAAAVPHGALPADREDQIFEKLGEQISSMLARLNPAPVEPVRAMVVPEGWCEFIAECAGMAGGMVNGNRLSLRAKELLPAAPTPEQPAMEQDQ